MTYLEQRVLHLQGTVFRLRASCFLASSIIHIINDIVLDDLERVRALFSQRIWICIVLREDMVQNRRLPAATSLILMTSGSMEELHKLLDLASGVKDGEVDHP